MYCTAAHRHKPLLLTTWPGVLQYGSAILTRLWASIGVTCSYSSRPFNALLTTTNASLLNCGFSMYTCCIGQKFLPPRIRHSSVTLPTHSTRSLVPRIFLIHERGTESGNEATVHVLAPSTHSRGSLIRTAVMQTPKAMGIHRVLLCIKWKVINHTHS